jgi:hypothetical protein
MSNLVAPELIYSWILRPGITHTIFLLVGGRLNGTTTTEGNLAPLSYDWGAGVCSHVTEGLVDGGLLR